MTGSSRERAKRDGVVELSAFRHFSGSGMYLKGILNMKEKVATWGC